MKFASRFLAPRHGEVSEECEENQSRVSRVLKRDPKGNSSEKAAKKWRLLWSHDDAAFECKSLNFRSFTVFWIRLCFYSFWVEFKDFLEFARLFFGRCCVSFTELSLSFSEKLTFSMVSLVDIVCWIVWICGQDLCKHWTQCSAKLSWWDCCYCCVGCLRDVGVGTGPSRVGN